MSEEEVSEAEVSEKETEETTETKGDDVPEGLSAKKRKKFLYRKKLNKLFDEYKSILIIQVDNVGSSQMQKVRIGLRGKAVMLLGKNTMMRSVIRERKDAKLQNILPAVVGNMGFVFTNGSMNEVRKIIEANKVPAAARVGSVAPSSVMVPPGPTGMDPGQTAFFQALGVATKIERGNISIVSEVEFVKKGDKVTSSHVVFLQKLKILPFFYAIKVDKCFENGSLFAVEVLDLSASDILTKFMSGVATIAALGFELGYPTTASVPFQMRHAFRLMLSLSIESGFKFDLGEKFLSGAAAAAAPAAAGPAKAAAKKEESEEEESEEESSGGALFGAMGGNEAAEESEYEDEE